MGWLNVIGVGRISMAEWLTLRYRTTVKLMWIRHLERLILKLNCILLLCFFD